MRVGLLALVGLCGCAAPSTTILVAVTADAAPDQIFVSLFDQHHDLVLGRPAAHAGPLPGQLIIEGLPSVSEEIRVVLAGTGALGDTLAGDRVTITPNHQVMLALQLSVTTPDRDRDGVPDAIDDCPTVSDREQLNLLGYGPGDACLGDAGLPTDGSEGDLSPACTPGCGPVGHCAGACLLTFAQMVEYPIGPNGSDMAVGDFDRDGFVDVLVTSDDGVRLFRNLGDKTGKLAPAVLLPAGNRPYGIGIGDFNHDGALDFMVAFETDSVVGVYLNDGKGSFPAPVAFPATSPEKFGIGDVDNDGDLDAVVMHSGGATTLLNAGDGTFVNTKTVDTGGSPNADDVADFDGDGRLDLVIASATSEFIFLHGHGDGNFGPPVNTAAGMYVNSACAGDLDGNGFADVVMQDAGDVNVSVFLGHGDGTFAPVAFYPSSSAVDGHNARIFDMNFDGRPDLIASGGSSNQVGVLLGNGDGTFQPVLPFNAGNNVERVIAADLDGDRRLDLLTVNQDSSTMGVLLNTSM
jgi:hypothetical protein